MISLRWHRLPALGVGLLGLACGGGGGSGGMGPCTPGAATQLVKTSGDPATWYFNNPLPTALSVTARDASGCPVPGVVVNWAVASSDGAISPAQSTTNASGVATTADSVGSTSPQTVTATFTGLPTAVTFTVSATTPPASAAVTVSNNNFNPDNSVIQTGGTVRWTWAAGADNHNVTFTSGPTPLPPSSGTQNTGSHVATITTVGTYDYHCTIHAGMDGTVRVVH
jgi:plastocyanin